MIRMRIALLAALLAVVLPARAMFGFGPVQTYFEEGGPDAWSGQAILVDDLNDDGLDDVALVYGNLYQFVPARLAVLLQDPATHELDAPTTYPIGPEEWGRSARFRWKPQTSTGTADVNW